MERLRPELDEVYERTLTRLSEAQGWPPVKKFRNAILMRVQWFFARDAYKNDLLDKLLARHQLTANELRELSDDGTSSNLEPAAAAVEEDQSSQVRSGEGRTGRGRSLAADDKGSDAQARGGLPWLSRALAECTMTSMSKQRKQ